MKLAIDIVKDLLLSALKKDSEFDAGKLNINYWETFTENLLDFEKDAKPLYAAIYSLELSDPENIISKLEAIYHSLITELAENHVLEFQSKAIEYLLVSKNDIFEKEVFFLTNLENAIKKVERNRIKQDLPKAFDRLTFELSDESIAGAIKKKEREALREKMKEWDQELAPTYVNVPIQPINNVKKTKVISLSWVKYAVAACLVLGIGVWFFKNQNNLSENKIVNVSAKKESISKPIIITEIPQEDLAEVEIVTQNVPVIENGLGFAPNNNTIKIVENNQNARVVSIVSAIKKYRKLLESEFIVNKSGVGPRIKELESKINTLQNELALLKKREKQYVFDGKTLVAYVSNTHRENSILLYENSYYLKRDTDFYKLSVSISPQPFHKEKSLEVLSELDKVYNGF